MQIIDLFTKFHDDQSVCKFLKEFVPKNHCIFYSDDWFSRTQEVVKHITDIAQNYQSFNFIYKITTPILFKINCPSNLKIEVANDGHQDGYPMKSWHKLKNQIPIHIEKKYDNICCPTGSINPARVYLILALHHAKLWNKDYCSQPFTFSLEYLLQIQEYHQLFPVKQIKKIAKQKNEWSYDRFDWINNLHILHKKHRHSFISIVSETHAHNSNVLVTEKLWAPIISKSIWIGHAPPLWHFIIEKFYGFKLFRKLFSYEFDEYESYTQRTTAIVSQISKLHALPYHEKEKIYKSIEDVLEFNLNHFRSANFQKHLVEQWKKYQDSNYDLDIYCNRR